MKKISIYLDKTISGSSYINDKKELDYLIKEADDFNLETNQITFLGSAGYLISTKKIDEINMYSTNHIWRFYKNKKGISCELDGVMEYENIRIANNVEKMFLSGYFGGIEND